MRPVRSSPALGFGLSIAGDVDLDGAPIIGTPSPAGLVLKLER
jgi:hypothetical protein